jgi:hypothetical protein
MERDIPFLLSPRVEGVFIRATLGWGDGRGGSHYGGAFLLIANPDGQTYTGIHRLFGPGGEVSDAWPDLTEAEAREVAGRLSRSQRRSANFAMARDERAARQMLVLLERLAWEQRRADGERLTATRPSTPAAGSPAPGSVPGRRRA